MTAAAILEILNALLSAAPEVLALLQKAQSGAVVTDADIQTVFNKYGVDRAVFQAAIAAAAKQGK